MESKEATFSLPKRKRHPDDGELDITPMIDMTFLLLSFFVVVSKMDPNTAVLMPKAKHGNSIQESLSVVMVVRAADTEEPAVFFGKGGKPDSKATGTIEDIETQIQDYLTREFNADPLKKHLIIKAEKRVIYKHMNIVKKAASAVMSEDYILNVGVEQE